MSPHWVKVSPPLLLPPSRIARLERYHARLISYQRRSRHDEPVPTRRSVRNRRRRGNRPRLGTLRTFHRFHDDPPQQLQHGSGVRKRYRQERRGDYLGGTVQVIPHVPTKSNDASTKARRVTMWRLSKSAVRSATSNRCRFGSHPPDAKPVGTQQHPVRPLELRSYIAAAGEIKPSRPSTP